MTVHASPPDIQETQLTTHNILFFERHRSPRWARSDCKGDDETDPNSVPRPEGRLPTPSNTTPRSLLPAA